MSISLDYLRNVSQIDTFTALVVPSSTPNQVTITSRNPTCNSTFTFSMNGAQLTGNYKLEYINPHRVSEGFCSFEKQDSSSSKVESLQLFPIPGKNNPDETLSAKPLQPWVFHFKKA